METHPITQEQFAEFVKRMDQRFDSVEKKLDELRVDMKSLENKMESRVNRIDSRLWKSAAALIIIALGALAKLTLFE